MSDRSVAVLVLGKSDQEIADFETRSPCVHDEARIVLVANPNKIRGGYATIANPFIGAATEEIVGVVHADTTFAPGTITTLAAVAAEGRVVGMVGAGPNGGEVWGKHGGGPVSTVDSCSVFFQRATGLRFDGATFDDFHCCVEDLCLQAIARGMSCYVPPVQADHIGYIDRPSNWIPNYRHYRNLLSQKWVGRRFFTT
jgi:hypothetical protein